MSGPALALPQLQDAGPFWRALIVRKIKLLRAARRATRSCYSASSAAMRSKRMEIKEAAN